MIPPAFISIEAKRSGSKPFRLWLPLFPLWPLLLAAFAFALPLAAIAGIDPLRLRWSPRPASLLLSAVSLPGAMKGMRIDVESKSREEFFRLRVV